MKFQWPIHATNETSLCSTVHFGVAILIAEALIIQNKTI